ncbi:MAG TPA: hypothetical protein VMV49_13555 [Candidatus Deferrimicrobium sp.]|nr:hypothetical protein [Candidatus Deferrimicrobium sp.]
MIEIQAMEEFIKNPTIENARKLGRAITEASVALEDKRQLYLRALEVIPMNKKVDAVLNMWMIGSYLESPVHYTTKVIAVREFLKDPNLTPELTEEWAWVVYKVNHAPKDLLDFLAVDIHNLRGISRDLRAILGHPSPNHPFRDE